MGLRPSEVVADLDAVGMRDHHVEDDRTQTGLRPDRMQGSVAGLGVHAVQTDSGEGSLHQAGELDVVLDDEDRTAVVPGNAPLRLGRRGGVTGGK